MSPAEAPVVQSDPIWERLEARIASFDRQSEVNKRLYQYIKVLQILSGAAVTLAAAVDAEPVITAGLGGLILVLEGVQQLFSYHDRWRRFRQACERLRREKYLFLARAEPFAGDDARTILASRVEAILSQELDVFVSDEHESPRA